MSNLHQTFTIPPALAETLQSSNRVAVLTGSGISAESGVPTFREAQTGLWSKYDPQALATPEAFENDPKLVWEWYRWRRGLVSRAEPNAGHLALVEMENGVPEFTLITQNVDGLHRLAGSKNVLEIHGNIMRSKCTADGQLYDHLEESGDALPVCPKCGSLLRPDVVWFGESLPPLEFNNAYNAALSCDLFVSIGTSGFVQPAASLAMEARRAGAVSVEINIAETPLTPYFSFALLGSASEVVPSLVQALP